MGLFDGIGGMGAGMLGLGLAGDIFGAYSQQQQQQRQRDIYNNYLQQQQRMQNPAYMIGQAQPYYQANLNAMKSALPQFMRSTVNPMLGGQGIDPMGGLGQTLTQQAMAPQIQGAWQNAMGQATGQQQSALNALQGAGQNVGQPTGQMGGTAGALQSLMLMQALKGYGGGQTGGFGTDTSGLGMDKSANYSSFTGGNYGQDSPSFMSMFGGK